MAIRDLPTPEVLRQLLRYEPATGHLYWMPRPREFCTSDGLFRRWARTFEGKRAFNCPDSTGYLIGKVLGKQTKAHRVVFAMAHGYWPTIVDHINGDRTDNRLENLREVTPAESRRNVGPSKTSASGILGVRLRNGRWHVGIKADGKERFLGSFETMEEARAARKRADEMYGFHENHGRQR